MSTIIFIADGWGSKYGGINSFNYDLCLNFSANLDCKKHNVICVTTGDILTEKELKIASEKNLKLINLAKSDWLSEIIQSKTATYCNNSDVWWIGHDIKTGFYAVECAKATNSKSAIIHHMNYHAYYTYLVDNPQKADEKHKKQQELFKMADLIFAVGPKLTQSADDILIKIGKNIKAIQLIPGITDIEPIEKTMNQFSAITFGRLSIDENDIIKQCKLALAAFAHSCKQDRNFSNGDSEIKLIGLNNSEIKKVNNDLREYASGFADRVINVKGYPYTEDRNDLFDVLKFSSVCMMLSLHEGFGLVGWEALSAGVPLIISKNSGLFEFLKNINMDIKVCAIDIKGDLNYRYDSDDIKNVSNELIKVKNNLETYKKATIELRRHLISQGYVWSNTALTIIKALGIETKKEAEIKKICKEIKSQLKTNSIISDNELLSEIFNEIKDSKTYNKVRDAYCDIAKDIKSSDFLNIHGMRCSVFCPDSDNDITDELNKRHFNVKVLMIHPFSEYVRKRLMTLPDYKKSEADLVLHHRNIYHTANTFKNRKKYDIKFFSLPLHFRLYFTQQHLYMSYYEDGIHARDLRVFCIDSNTKTYHTFEAYYNYIWNNSNEELLTEESQIPSEYRYLAGDEWYVKPSLVINVCATCNMNCKYCPEGGENLKVIKEDQYCKNKDLSNLVKNFLSCGGNSVVRITGGEPLLNPVVQDRTCTVLKSAIGYDKIVLCTNGINLKSAYDSRKKTWNDVKDKLLLKISLDTLNRQYFEETTGCSAEYLELIKTNIEFAKKNGFKIELNVVAKKNNVNEILAIFDYAKNKELVGVKVLTVNDFGGAVDIDESEQKYVEKELQKIINKLRRKGFKEWDVSLNDGVGIKMKKFCDNTGSDSKCILTIVDHNSKKGSITPKRTFCEFCRNCKHFPCATGIMNLTLRADGVLSQCRLKEDNLYKINDLSRNQMKEMLKKMMEPFNKCFLFEDEGESK